MENTVRHHIVYVSINSVLHDIHSMVDSTDWDEDKMKEWAVKGLRKFNLPAKYEDCVVFLEVKDHVAQLPSDIKYINQLFYQVEHYTTLEELVEYINESLGITDTKPFYSHMAYPNNVALQILDAAWFLKNFRVLRKSSHEFGVSPCVQQELPSYACPHTYTLFDKCSIQTSFRNGCVALSYKRYVKDCDGNDMVPDNENLKDALYHFCMYRWWLSRDTYKEEGAQQRAMFHYRQYEVLGKRAVADLNSPSLDLLENIKNYRDRLIPRENMFEKGFGPLSNQENLDHYGRYHAQRTHRY
jgi:hypothetical protein